LLLAGLLVTSEYGMGYYFSPNTGAWFCDPTNSAGFVNTYSKAATHSFSGVPSSKMWGIHLESFVQDLGKTGWSDRNISEEILFINAAYKIAFVDANGTVIEDIPLIASFFTDENEMGTFVVTGQMDAKTGKGYNVAQLGDTFFVGKGADLVDIASLLDKQEYHALALELINMDRSKSFAAHVLWNVGWSLRQQGKLHNATADILDPLAAMGTPPVPYPQGITFIDNAFSLTTTRND
jgi:hypothetical protein